MKIGGLCLKPRLIPVFLLAAGVFFGAGLVSPSTLRGSQKVEIVIQTVKQSWYADPFSMDFQPRSASQ